MWESYMQSIIVVTIFQTGKLSNFSKASYVVSAVGEFKCGYNAFGVCSLDHGATINLGTM